jgi:hypothetical protein
MVHGPALPLRAIHIACDSPTRTRFQSPACERLGFGCAVCLPLAKVRQSVVGNGEREREEERRGWLNRGSEPNKTAPRVPSLQSWQQEMTTSDLRHRRQDPVGVPGAEVKSSSRRRMLRCVPVVLARCCNVGHTLAGAAFSVRFVRGE